MKKIFLISTGIFFVISLGIAAFGLISHYEGKNSNTYGRNQESDTNLTAPDQDRMIPLVTVAQGSMKPENAAEWLKRFGANHVWIKDGSNDENAHFFKDLGFTALFHTNPSLRTGGARTNEEWVYSFLKTQWHKKETEKLEIALFENFDSKHFKIAAHVDPTIAIKVQEKETGKMLTPSEWKVQYNTNTLIITGGSVGNSYRVIFLSGEITSSSHTSNPLSDGTALTAKERHMNQIKNLLTKCPSADIIRPTSNIYYFTKYMKNNQTMVYSWFAYNRGMRPERLDRFEKIYGQPFDPLWMADSCYGEEGFIPTPGYRQWIDLIRKDLSDYAKEYTTIAHDAGKRVRWFFGDNWIGIEPYLGDVDAVGYDEIVTSMNRGKKAVRYLMDFEGKVRRIIRFPWVRENPQMSEREIYQARQVIAAEWRWIKREILFNCPDGITFGGSIDEAVKTPAVEDYIQISHDFQKIHSLIYSKNIYKNDLKIYVLNAWGKMRSWHIGHYKSLKVFDEMVDWPVDIQWISFEEVIQKGIPKDASLILLAGEPNTAWGGGEYWNNGKLQNGLRTFVKNGGGLMVIGGPTYVDGKFALSDVLGVEYAGPSNQWVKEELWNQTRWVDAGYDPKEYNANLLPMGSLEMKEHLMPEDIREHLSDLSITVQYDSKIKPTGAKQLSESSEEGIGVFLNSYGKGRAVYISGYAQFDKLLKVLSYYAAGKIEKLNNVNSNSMQIATYFYPESNLLIAFNHSGSEAVGKIFFDPRLAGVKNKDSEFTMEVLDTGEKLLIKYEDIKNGLDVTLKSGEAVYWKISTEN